LSIESAVTQGDRVRRVAAHSGEDSELSLRRMLCTELLLRRMLCTGVRALRSRSAALASPP
ncbi:MAG: hypothetical protein ACRDRL_31635, partial [Sciscionella sp.]